MTEKSPRPPRNIPVDLSSISLLSPEQVAELLGVSVTTLAVWRCRGRYRLPYVKVGSRVMYRPRAVEEFLRERDRGTGVSE